MKKHLVPTVACAALGIAGVAHGDVLFFVSQAEFQAALEQAGKVLDGFEEYPWLAGPDSVIGVDDPLNVNTAVPGWLNPGVLLDNVSYQANLDPFGSNGPNPRGGTGLALFTTGFIRTTHNGIVSGHFVDSFDIISGLPNPANHTAMGLQLISFNNSPAGSSITVSVYDEDNNLAGQIGNISAPLSGGTFLGILTTGGDTIGRVNLYDTNPGFDAEGLYSLAVYVSEGPQDCPADLDEDGEVGVKDLLELLGAWGPCP